MTAYAVDEATAIRVAGVVAGVDSSYGDAVHALVLRLIDERDRARSIAVRLEQETTELRAAVTAWRSGRHRRAWVQDGPDSAYDVCAVCVDSGDLSWPCAALTVRDVDREVRTFWPDDDLPF